jgi:hypothetical protein
MTKPTKKQQSNPWPSNPSNIEATKLQKQQAEATEVIGKHKNDGQKDHKGAR